MTDLDCPHSIAANYDEAKKCLGVVNGQNCEWWDTDGVECAIVIWRRIISGLEKLATNTESLMNEEGDQEK